MSDIEDSFEAPPILPRSERLFPADKAWVDANGALSMKKAARQYDIVYSTLYNQIHESTSFEESRTARQRLPPGEEQAMKIWLLQLALPS
jgi:hypothetical protein